MGMMYEQLDYDHEREMARSAHDALERVIARSRKPEAPIGPAWAVNNPDWPSGDGPHLIPSDSAEESPTPCVPCPSIGYRFCGTLAAPSWEAYTLTVPQVSCRGRSPESAINLLAIREGIAVQEEP